MSADSKQIGKQPSLKSNSIKRPTMSASFYHAARQMQAAVACKPFDGVNGQGQGDGHQNNQENNCKEQNEETKRTLKKLIKLIGINQLKSVDGEKNAQPNGSDANSLVKQSLNNECINKVSDFQLLDINSDQNQDCVNSEACQQEAQILSKPP